MALVILLSTEVQIFRFGFKTFDLDFGLDNSLQIFAHCYLCAISLISPYHLLAISLPFPYFLYALSLLVYHAIFQLQKLL